jgi:UDP-N-acetyl-D-glucosamine dehydrogenase
MSLHSNADRVGVIGVGYVGLPLSLAMTNAGYEVIGVDVNQERVQRINEGCSHITDVTDQQIREHLGERLSITTDYTKLEDVEGISICVPTPLRNTGQPDISYIVDATERLTSVISPGTTVVLESTVYPSATEDVVAGILEDHGFSVGDDMFVAFSPERIDPGNDTYEPSDIPKVIGGVTTDCTDHAAALYQPVFDDVVRVESAIEAEMTKLLENTFRSVNIALINELATIAHELDVDIWSVIDAAATKPFGFMPFYPGPGLGGHCIPIDPLYLSWKADQHGIDTRFIDLASNINRKMPTYVVRRLTTLLNRTGVPLTDATVLVVGIAYKSNVTDTRESPALDIMVELEEREAEVEYHDPHVPSVDVGERTYRSVLLTDERLTEADCVIIVTDHDDLDIERVADESELVFDTRNATADIGERATVYRL